MTFPCCQSCGRSTRTHARPSYCAKCTESLARFHAFFCVQETHAWSVGDRVKVVEQDIWGPIVEVTPSYVVIDDEDSEFAYPESRLEFRHDEVERHIGARTP